MESRNRVQAGLRAAMARGNSPLSPADRLCRACVDLLDIDGAAVSLAVDGRPRGTFGASGKLSRRLDELQFTFGEGPCVDAVAQGKPVLVADLDNKAEQRWPAFSGAALKVGVQAVFALPLALSPTPALGSAPIGALDLFRRRAGSLSDDELAGGMHAAELASGTLVELLGGVDWSSYNDGGDGGEELASLERVEVYQATGMIMGQLDVGAGEALARLRAYAFANDLTASEIAWRIVRRQLKLTPDDV